MSATASDLPRLRLNSSGIRFSEFGEHGRFMLDPYGVLMDIQTPGPRTEHWALQAWPRASRPVWVNRGATGLTRMNPAAYRHLTTHHLDMVALPLDLLETVEELDDLRHLPPGWNGYNVSAPSHTAIRAAEPWVRMFYSDAITATGRWITPHVTADESGEVMFEWSNGDKALTAYVSEGEVTLARDWGPDIETEMESVVDPPPNLCREWWTWLTG